MRRELEEVFRLALLVAVDGVLRLIPVYTETVADIAKKKKNRTKKKTNRQKNL